MILTYRTRKEAEIVSRNVDLFICTFCSFIAFLHMFVCSWGQVGTTVGSPKFHECTQAGFMNFIVNMIDSALIINVSDDERIGPSHFFFFFFISTPHFEYKFLYYHHVFPHLRACNRPTRRPAPSWPDSFTGGARRWHCRGQGSIHSEKGLKNSGLSRCYLSSAKNAIMKFIHYHFYY